MKVLWLVGVTPGFGHLPIATSPIGIPPWILGHLPPPDGVELHIAVPVVGAKESRLEMYRGASFHLFPQRRFEAAFLFYRLLPELLRIHRSVKPDVVHGWGTESGVGVSATRLPCRRIVLSIQGILRECRQQEPSWGASRQIMLALEGKAIRRAHAILSESEWSASAVERHYGRRPLVVRHPLRSEFLEASPVKTREKRAAFVGSLVGRKGAPDGVRAFLQTAPNDWMFDVVGGGELLTSLQTKVAQSGRNNVRFHGVLEVNKLLEVLAAASVFLLPTYVDTGPTALKEAIALGLWPICYDNSGPAELLRRYEVGSLVKTGDIAMLASTVSDVLGAFGEDSAHRIDVASKAIRRDLHPNAIWPRLLELYR